MNVSGRSLALALALALALPLGLVARVTAATLGTPETIDRFALPFEAKAKTHAAAAVYANFAGNGEKYVRYDSEPKLARALQTFLDGPAPGGESFVARSYRIAGSKGLYVTFDSAVQTSLTVRERVLFDASSHAVRLEQEVRSSNGFFRTVRTAYFARGKPISDETVRYDYAPDDMTFSHPLKSHAATLDAEEMTIPAYETRAELPFAE